MNLEVPGKIGKYGLFLCVAVFALYAIPARAAEDARDIAARLESSKRSLNLQTELPEKNVRIEIQGETSRLGRLFSGVVSGLLRFFDEIRKIAKILLLVSIIAIALMIALHLHENLWSLSRARKLEFRKNETEARSAALERMEHSQAEADELARTGSFAEAMHVLLLRSVSEMRTRFTSPIAASLTSREILGLAMSPEERGVFARIVGGVEISRFGTYNPGEDEYLECRKNFDALTELLRGRRP